MRPDARPATQQVAPWWVAGTLLAVGMLAAAGALWLFLRISRGLPAGASLVGLKMAGSPRRAASVLASGSVAGYQHAIRMDLWFSGCSPVPW